MKPFLTNNSLNLSDDELINTFSNMIESPPPIVSSASATTSTTTTTTNTDNVIICPNPNQASSTSTTPPQSILKQTDYKIKINNKQNTKSFLPYSSPIINFKNSSSRKPGSSSSKSGNYSNNNEGHHAFGFNGVAKKEKLTIMVDDTPFFLTSDSFNSYPNTYLGQ